MIGPVLWLALQLGRGTAGPIVSEPLPYDQWVYTADAAKLPRDANGNPIRG